MRIPVAGGGNRVALFGPVDGDEEGMRSGEGKCEVFAGRRHLGLFPCLCLYSCVSVSVCSWLTPGLWMTA